MTRTVWLLVATLALVLTACGGSSSATHDIKGTAWTVSTIGGQATVPGAQPTIAFGSDGTISGSTGCNTYSGTYTVDGDRLTVSQLAMTRKACADPAVNTQEGAVTAGLTGATSWSIGSDGNLTIKGATEIVAKPGAAAT
jgi:heat shock protein HslJ